MEEFQEGFAQGGARGVRELGGPSLPLCSRRLYVSRTGYLRPAYHVRIIVAWGAITIKKLEKAGLRVRPGQEVAYIIAGLEPLRTIPLILNPGIYDSSEYIKLLKRASETILNMILKNEK